MTTYKLIKERENDSVFLDMLRKGIISLGVLDKKVYYERYLVELEATGNNWQAVINTADEFNVSEATVRRAVKFMEK